MGGQGTKCQIKISENFNRLSRVYERYRQTTDDRQTDRRQQIANVNVSSLKSVMIVKLAVNTDPKPNPGHNRKSRGLLPLPYLLTVPKF